MNIGIIVSGNMGAALGTVWARAGHGATAATAWVQFAAVSGLFPNVAFKALRR